MNQNLALAISCALVAVVALIALGWRICMMVHQHVQNRLRDVKDRYVTESHVRSMIEERLKSL